MRASERVLEAESRRQSRDDSGGPTSALSCASTEGTRTGLIGGRRSGRGWPQPWRAVARTVLMLGVDAGDGEDEGCDKGRQGSGLAARVDGQQPRLGSLRPNGGRPHSGWKARSRSQPARWRQPSGCSRSTMPSWLVGAGVKVAVPKPVQACGGRGEAEAATGRVRARCSRGVGTAGCLLTTSRLQRPGRGIFSAAGRGRFGGHGTKPGNLGRRPITVTGGRLSEAKGCPGSSRESIKR